MLHGRSDDCAALSDLLTAAQRGESHAVALRGEAGVGKTALLDWFAEETEQQQASLLRCAGVESETDLPFAALHQLLRPAISAMPALPRLQQEALNGALGLSGRRGSDPFLVAVATLSLLGEIAVDHGLTCIIDDAQWLDPASAEVLRFVARRLDADGIVLVFAIRDPSDASFPTPGLADHLLDGLDAAAAASLLVERAPMISAEVKARLVQHHAGNPLAIIELAPLLSDGQMSGEEPLPDPMPMGGEVERLYAARAAALGEGAQRLLLLAATADSDELGLVLAAGAVIGIPAESLHEAEESGLISAGRGVLRFKHPLVRSAIYQQSSFLDRQQGHEAMAGLLTSEAEADRRAWHLVRAATGLDDALADLLEVSADRALTRGGAASAIDRWQWAAEFTTADASRCRRFVKAAQTAFHADQPERARQLLSTAQALAATPREHAEITALDGSIELRHGAPEAAYDLLFRSAHQLAPHDSKAALEALVLAGEAATFLGDPQRTSEVGGLADTLRDTADADDMTMVDLLIGLGKLFEGNWADGAEILARVVDQSVEGAEYEHVLRSGRAAMYLGRLTDARDLYARAANHARDTGTAGPLTPMLDRLAYIELLLNRLPDSEAHALEGLRLASDLGLDAGVAVTSLATVHAYRGEDSACRARVAQAHEVAADRQLKMIGAAAQWALGLLELGAGRPHEALSALLTVASEAQGHPGILRWATADLVEAAVRSGQPEACAPALARLEAWAAASGLAAPGAMLARCRGLMSSGEEAIGHFESALALDAGASRPLERARIELLLGETLRRDRHRIRARDHLRNALLAFERLGAAPWGERARAELRATGETTRPRDASGLEQLTPQELQIAQYAADGESNADIAAKLFLSRRTVEYHLGKVYTKVGVTSRRELASTTLARL